MENYCLQPCSSYLKLGREGSRCRNTDSTTSLRENVYMPDAYTNCILFGTEEVNLLGSVLCPYWPRSLRLQNGPQIYPIPRTITWTPALLSSRTRTWTPALPSARTRTWTPALSPPRSWNRTPALSLHSIVCKLQVERYCKESCPWALPSNTVSYR